MTINTIAVADALTDVTNRLAAAGCENARLDARLLLAHTAGLTLADQTRAPEQPLTAEARQKLQTAAAERARRVPLAQIVGEKEFWSLPIAVSPDVLIPRPESEILVENILRRLGSRRQDELRVLDFGTGSGCLLLALLSELPAAKGVGVDLSQSALAVARTNAARLQLDNRAAFAVGDWHLAEPGRFDVIVANPPYVRSGDIAGLEPELRHEPPQALDGGTDGLDAYRRLLPRLAKRLGEGGVAGVEIGADQATPAARLATDVGLPTPELCHDLAGLPRCLIWVRQTGPQHEKTLGNGGPNE